MWYAKHFFNGAKRLAVFEGQDGDLTVVQHFFGLAFAEEAFEPTVFFGKHDDHIHVVFTNKFIQSFLYVLVIDVMKMVGDMFEHGVEYLNFGWCIGRVMTVVVIDIQNMNFGIE